MLDINVKSFLIRLAMDAVSMHTHYRSSKASLKILSNLSNDRRFQEALKDAKKDFEKSYDVLIGFQTE
jgi:hypothetical protein